MRWRGIFQVCVMSSVLASIGAARAESIETGLRRGSAAGHEVPQRPPLRDCRGAQVRGQERRPTGLPPRWDAQRGDGHAARARIDPAQ